MNPSIAALTAAAFAPYRIGSSLRMPLVSVIDPPSLTKCCPTVVRLT